MGGGGGVKGWKLVGVGEGGLLCGPFLPDLFMFLWSRGGSIQFASPVVRTTVDTSQSSLTAGNDEHL